MASTSSQFASRYAKAFMGVLLEMDKSDLQVFEDQLQTLSILSEGETRQFFQSPLFEAEEKKKVLDRIFEEHDMTEEVKRFIYALNQTNHLYILDEVSDAFGKELLEQNQQVKVALKTAYPIKDEEKSRIQSVFEKMLKKDVFIQSEVDQSLIGGIRANVGGVVYDASIAGYLDRLQKQVHK